MSKNYNIYCLLELVQQCEKNHPITTISYTKFLLLIQPATNVIYLTEKFGRGRQFTLEFESTHFCWWWEKFSSNLPHYIAL